MPKRSSLLDSINIASPCSAAWDEMIGNDQVRFCRHCSLHVHDLSKITRKDAIKLVAAAKGKLCVRYSRHPNGAVRTASHAQPLTHIKRRLSRIAAGAFTATLSLASNAVAQSAMSVERNPTVAVQPKEAVRESALPDDSNKLTDLPLLAEVTVDVPVKVIEDSVQGGAIVVSPDTPLIKAIWEGNVDTVRDLLAEGVDVNLLDKNTQSTALSEAVAGGNLELVRTLLYAGADPNARNSFGRTALMSLDYDGTAELVQALVDGGAKVNLEDEDGDTALMAAATMSKVEVVQALLAAGAKVNAKNNEGRTALMMATAEEDHAETVEALLLAGADVHRKDKEGKTALSYARENGYEKICDLLIAYGAFE